MKPVIWTAEARRDYLDTLRYIASDNAVAAQKVGMAIEKAGNSLGLIPTGRPGRAAGTYEKSVARLPYVIVYALSRLDLDESVVILRVIHTARDWPPA